MAGDAPRRDQDRIEPDVANADVGISRQPSLGSGNDGARWRSVTDQAASSRSGRALTSTKINRLLRRATMSISPTGLLKRRATMRNPLAMSKAAARLSAEIPVRNATCRLRSFSFGSWLFGSARARERAYRIVTHAL